MGGNWPQWIAFDADDTLWANEALYRQARAEFEAMMANYGHMDGLAEIVHRVEIENLVYYGYGAIGFIVSLIEAGIEITGGRISSADIQRLLKMSKEMISAEVELLPGAAQVVADLAGRYPLLLITKGDLQHQMAKVGRSGLKQHFQAVEVVSEKSPDVYWDLLNRHAIDPAAFLMVGNSMRSDVLPVVEIGGRAVHVENEMTWDYEAIEAPDDAEGRYRTIERLSELPAAIQQLRAAG